jgi:hypothetical protein
MASADGLKLVISVLADTYSDVIGEKLGSDRQKKTALGILADVTDEELGHAAVDVSRNTPTIFPSDNLPAMLRLAALAYRETQRAARREAVIAAEAAQPRMTWLRNMLEPVEGEALRLAWSPVTPKHLCQGNPGRAWESARQAHALRRLAFTLEQLARMRRELETLEARHGQLARR